MTDLLDQLKETSEYGELQIDFTTVIMWMLGVLLLIFSSLQI